VSRALVATRKRLPRLRWVLLGTLTAAGLTLAVAALLGLFVGWNGVDSKEAAKVADKWAAAHRRATETYMGSDCATDAGGYRFVCRVRYRPTGRDFTLFMRKEAPNGHYEIVLTQVRRGIYPVPDPDSRR
jgi:hypothetical protein